MSIYNWTNQPEKLAAWTQQAKGVDKCVNQYWFKNGKLHRIGRPAVTRHDGTMKWYCSGQLHHLDGPAIQYPGGYDRWVVLPGHKSARQIPKRV